jgi:restriction system protein
MRYRTGKYMTQMWMVRAEGGLLYDEFRERGVVAIGWAQLAPHAKQGMPREQLAAIYRQAEPQMKRGSVISGASQVWRFINEIKVGDKVVTYSPANRTYLVGDITGACEYKPEWAEDGMSLARPVNWHSREINRDDLANSSKNSLGSTLTVFLLPAPAADDLMAKLSGEPLIPTASDQEPTPSVDEDPLANIELDAIERIKDLVSALDWSEMQELVAGLLRAMNYKTQISPSGADRGKDIVASPDGFGFENPRIVVEVKHRSGQMGSQAIRSFLGGRHKDDRGLYVSTGGFSKDAHYEAERAPLPLALWTLDNLVRALIDHYDKADETTKRLVPLKRIYWPA